MRSFVGVPIVVRDKVYGRLYITEKRDGGPFVESDEELALALAAIAGAAVRNVLLYGATRPGVRARACARRRPWAHVPGDIAAHMLVVLREGLSNVARHAAATAAQVEIEAGDALVARVIDNGVGLVEDPASGGYGLQNMRERAGALGGKFRVASRPEGGTKLEWQVQRST